MQVVMLPACMTVAILFPSALEAFCDTLREEQYTLNLTSDPVHVIRVACVRDMVCMQMVMFPVCITVAILFPSALEAFRDTLRQEHYKAATWAIRALEADEGLARLQAAPEVTKQLDLQVIS
ncbi:g7658 [Coccomyxa elongata]